MSGWKIRAFAAIRVVLGLLLLAAAGFKIYGWSVSTIPPVGRFSAPGVQASAAGWEIFLGAWLLSGVAPVGSWLAAIGTFALLAAISGYLGWNGQARCGCFGTIEASPWHALTVDGVSLGLLAVGWPNWQRMTAVPRREKRRIAVLTAYGVLGVGVILGSSAGIAAWTYGSPEIALARLRGDALIVVPEFVDLGTGKPGDTLEAMIEVRNLIDRPIRLLGGTSDCSCVTTRGLPITLAPGESRAIPIHLKVRQSQQRTFTRTAELWTDDGNQKAIRFRLGCRVE